MATIRLASPEDAPACAAIYAPYVRDTPVSFEYDPPSTDEMAARIAGTLETYPWLVCEHEGAVVGFAYAGGFRGRDAYRWSVESSVYVAEAYRGAGVGTGLYTSLLATLHRQGFYTVVAVTSIPNPSSVGFHRSMGFEPIGVVPNVGYKKGAWHDVQFWRFVLRPPAADPDPTRPIGDLSGTAELDDAVASGVDDVSL